MKSIGFGWLGVVALTALAGYVFFPVGQQIAHGMTRGEPFQWGRPESYWIEALNCKDQGPCNTAIEALARMGPRIVPDLIQKAEDPKFLGRADCYEAMAKMGEAAVPALVEAVKKDQTSWGVCQPVLAKIGAPAIPPLIGMLRGEDSLRAFAAGAMAQMVALGEIGPAAKAALPELMRVLEKPVGNDRSVHVVVKQLVKKIDPEFAKQHGIK